MSLSVMNVDRRCRACGKTQASIIVETRRLAGRNIVIVDLRCGACSHEWTDGVIDPEGPRQDITIPPQKADGR